jgi:hypothetical protein
MTTKNSFSQITKKLKRAERGFSDPVLMHPSREWWFGIISALLIFVGGAVWSKEIDARYRTAVSTEAPTVSEEVVIYRESMVETALEDFAKRQREHEQLLKASQNNIQITETVEKEEDESEIVEGQGTTTASESGAGAEEGSTESEDVSTTTPKLAE